MLKELTLFGEVDKVKVAIDRLRELEPPEGYYLAFSGGKDSQCIYHLALMAGVKFDAHYNLTTADPPELVHFIRRYYPEVEVHRPAETMWQLIPRKLMPPTRMVRYCCSELKEGGGSGRVVVTGVRWAESVRRKNSRKMVETCFRDSSKTYVNPIIDWEDEDVWEFIREVAQIPYCELYDQGFNRLGCVGCPMSQNQELEFNRWPKFRASYVRAFDRMIAERKRRGKPVQWENGEEVMTWWLNRNRKSKGEGQLMMLE